MLSAVYRTHNGQEHNQSVCGDYRQQRDGIQVQHWISLGALTHPRRFGFGFVPTDECRKEGSNPKRRIETRFPATRYRWPISPLGEDAASTFLIVVSAMAVRSIVEA